MLLSDRFSTDWMIKRNFCLRFHGHYMFRSCTLILVLRRDIAFSAEDGIDYVFSPRITWRLFCQKYYEKSMVIFVRRKCPYSGGVNQAVRVNTPWYPSVYLALCDPCVTRSWNRCCALLETDRRAHVHELCAGHALFMATERGEENKTKTKQQKWHFCDNAEFLKVINTEYWSLREELNVTYDVWNCFASMENLMSHVT